jgi:hypothetical protein
MAPLKKSRKAAPGSSNNPKTDEVGDTQAGRSPSSMVVERRSAGIRSEISLPGATQDGTSTSSRTGSSSTQLERDSSVLSLNRRSSYAPVVPSPLNPSSSRSSVSSSEVKDVVNGEVSPRIPSPTPGEVPRSQSSSNIATLSKGSKVRGGSSALSPPQQLLRQKSTPALQMDKIPRPETPKHLHDLGRDYSRYPLPISKRSSYTGSLATERPHPAELGQSPSLLRTSVNNPFNDSQANLEKWGYPDDSIGAFDPYFGGEKGFILYPNEVEPDDKYHMPADDDDLTFKPNWKEYFETRSIISTIGGIFLVLGLLCVFVVLPVFTFATKIYVPTGSGGSSHGPPDYGPAWAHVNNRTYPLIQNVRRGLIDPDTPNSAMTRTSTFDGSTLNLVFSDEFNDNNRTFYPGDDPYWYAYPHTQFLFLFCRSQKSGSCHMSGREYPVFTQLLREIAGFWIS